jgi:hypothetical protein
MAYVDERSKMQSRLFKLTPIDLTHRDWAASTHKTYCHVHAGDESLARRYASNNLWVAAGRALERELPVNPWNQPDRVDCREVAHIGPAPLVEGMVELPG